MQHNPCEICLDEKCNGTHICHCQTCSHRKECYKFLHPTIRLTTKCTQSCSHCCFSCSPKSEQMMTLDMAKLIQTFLKNNHIYSLNVMGGEFFCNPNWYEILNLFLSVNCFIRLVSNGDWAGNDDIQNKLLHLHQSYPKQLHISISNDKWHTNKNIKLAEQFLNNHKFEYNMGTKEESSEDSIVPIGRSECSFGFYGMFACYCHNPKHNYSFLIDEIGNIYKCSFGVWNYANIKDYQNGGFAPRFKEFNKVFYKIFLPSCTSCIRSASNHNSLVKN